MGAFAEGPYDNDNAMDYIGSLSDQLTNDMRMAIKDDEVGTLYVCLDVFFGISDLYHTAKDVYMEFVPKLLELDDTFNTWRKPELRMAYLLNSTEEWAEKIAAQFNDIDMDELEAVVIKHRSRPKNPLS